MRRPHVVVWIAFVLVIIGALNWGLVGVAQFDLVAAIFGAGSMLARLVYILVGLSGIAVAVWLATATRTSHGAHGSERVR